MEYKLIYDLRKFVPQSQLRKGEQETKCLCSPICQVTSMIPSIACTTNKIEHFPAKCHRVGVS